MLKTVFTLSFSVSLLFSSASDYNTIDLEIEEISADLELLSVLDGGGDDGGIEGYLIHTDTAVAYLQEVLKQAGLNATKSDVITFCAPRVVDQKYALIQFKIDKKFIEEISKIKVGPKPASLKKVYMVLSNTSEKEIDSDELKKKLISLDRNGYKVVEWGGTNIPKSSVIGAL